jgi:uncharacterized protein YqeY
MLAAIDRDYIAAYKAKDQNRVDALRLLKSALKVKEKDVLRPLTDDDVLATLAREVKQRQDSIEQYRAGGREDLAAKEAQELEILRQYLPAQLSEQKLGAIVEKTVAELGASSLKDMGRVMQAVLGQHKGSVDGKVLSDLVRRRLSA